MKCNVGREDASWRAIGGITMAMVGWYLHAWWGFAGVIVLVTAMISFCPLYKLFGINTCKDDAAGTKPGGSKTADPTHSC